MKKTAFLALIALFSLASATAGTRVVVKRTYTVRPTVARAYVAPPATRTVVVSPRLGCVDINCNRKSAAVYVNGGYVGVAGKYDGFPGKLELKPGVYTIKVVDGAQTYRQRVRVVAGGEVDLKIKF